MAGQHSADRQAAAVPAHPAVGGESAEAVRWLPGEGVGVPEGRAADPSRTGQLGGARGLPVLVAVPAHLDPGGGVVFEVRQRPDGLQALPVFSSVGRLAAVLGAAQPWAVLPLDGMRELMGAAGVPQVVLDPTAEPGTWRWRPQDLRALAGRLG